MRSCTRSRSSFLAASRMSVHSARRPVGVRRRSAAARRRAGRRVLAAPARARQRRRGEGEAAHPYLDAAGGSEFPCALCRSAAASTDGRRGAYNFARLRRSPALGAPPRRSSSSRSAMARASSPRSASGQRQLARAPPVRRLGALSGGGERARGAPSRSPRSRKSVPRLKLGQRVRRVERERAAVLLERLRAGGRAAATARPGWRAAAPTTESRSQARLKAKAASSLRPADGQRDAEAVLRARQRQVDHARPTPACARPRAAPWPRRRAPLRGAARLRRRRGARARDGRRAARPGRGAPRRCAAAGVGCARATRMRASGTAASGQSGRAASATR